MDDIKFNDGGGLLDNIGMIDSLLVDVSELPKYLMCGEYIRFCGKIPEMVKKLALLKQGVKRDTESLKARVKELTEAKDGGTDV